MNITFAGKKLAVVTLGQLAKMSDRKYITLRKWEEKGWLPPSNLRLPNVPMKNGKTRPGARVYSAYYAVRMAEVIKRSKQGIELPHDIIVDLYNIVKQERLKLNHYASKEKGSGTSKKAGNTVQEKTRKQK